MPEPKAMTPIERAARALHLRRAEGSSDNFTWEALSRREQALFLADARAVLTAIRDSSETMDIACYEEIEAQGGNAWSPFGLWRAMIDAALADESTPSQTAMGCISDDMIEAGRAVTQRLQTDLHDFTPEHELRAYLTEVFKAMAEVESQSWQMTV